VERFQAIPSSLASALPKWEVKWRSWSVIMRWGSPNHGCRDSLLYKGSEDDDELGLEVTG